MNTPIKLTTQVVLLTATSFSLVLGPSVAYASNDLTIATFSAVGYDPATHELGIAVQSKFFAVGAVAPYAQAGVGAIASQAFANTTFGARGLKLLREGLTVQETLDLLLATDPQRQDRQVGIVDAKGNSVTFTGKKCVAWAGGRNGTNFAVQGNILVSEATVAAMERAFNETTGMLGEKLIRALEEGQKAGGDSRGMQSAAILIVKEGAGYGGYSDRYCDLRVDDHSEPIKELRRLFNMWKVRVLIGEGYRLIQEREYDRAIEAGKQALSLDATSGEAHYNLACYYARAGKKADALKMLQEAIGLDAKLAPRAAVDRDFEPLREDPEFKKVTGE